MSRQKSSKNVHARRGPSFGDRLVDIFASFFIWATICLALLIPAGAVGAMIYVVGMLFHSTFCQNYAIIIASALWLFMCSVPSLFILKDICTGEFFETDDEVDTLVDELFDDK